MASFNLDTLVLLAQSIAESVHAGQYRRDGVTPYINHVRDVVERVSKRYDGNRILIMIAWLHDTVEDTPVTIEMLSTMGFPIRVIIAVAKLTRDPKVPYEQAIEEVLTCSDAMAVKIEDHISNLSDGPSFKQIAKYGKSLTKIMDKFQPSNILADHHCNHNPATP